MSPNKRNSENFQKAAAEEFFTNATKTWEEVYETPLGKVLPKVSSLTPRKSKNEKRKTTRSIQRQFKNAVEGVIHENSLITFMERENQLQVMKKDDEVYISNQRQKLPNA